MDKKSKINIKTSLGKGETIAFLLIPIIGIISLLFLYFHNPIESKVFPKCIFLEYAGVYCPGCGVTRSTYYLVHGDILKAFRFNQLYILFLPLMVYLYILNLGLKINGKELMKIPRFNSFFYILIGVLSLVFCILRNIHYYPFTLLAP